MLRAPFITSREPRCAPGLTPPVPARAGFTLIEILAAAIIGILIAAGTLMAFVTAAQLSSQVAPYKVEASHLAQQTLERFRNRIACDDDWFDAVTCNGSPQSGPHTIPASSSITNLPLAVRTYNFAPGADVDGDGTFDYYTMQVTVCWNDPGCAG
jgi:Tfp pilus assembly protein PilV